MKDYGSKTGSVSAGTDFQAVEGDATPTGFDDGPKGEQVPKGPGSGVGAGGIKIH